MAKPINKLSQIQPDTRNANRGNVRGRAMLESSMRKFGFLEPGVLDMHGNIVGGNKRTEVAVDIGMDDPIIIDTDGTRPVYVRRTNLDLNTKEGREAAIALNRTAQQGIEWDPDVLRELGGEGVDLSGMWTQEELSELLATVPDFQPAGIDEQGRLDEKAKCTCPECGHIFAP